MRTLFAGMGIAVVKGTVWVVVAAAATVGTTAAISIWNANRTVILPNPGGPFAVGRSMYAWRDEVREDPLVRGGGAKRELMVWLWYPAEATGGGHPAAYLPDPWMSALEQTSFDQKPNLVRAHAIEEAPVAAAQARYPVLIFSPGSGGLPFEYTALAEELASHGYVVAGVAHTYSSRVVVFPDRRIARSSQARFDGGDDRLVTIWAADLISLLNEMQRAQATGGTSIFARLDLQRIGVLGHSFGGAAAAQACSMDARFKAGMDLDGSVHGDVTKNGVSQPFFFMIGRYDNAVQKQEINFILERSPEGYILTIKNLTHGNFGDRAVFFDPGEKFAELVGARLDGRKTLTIANAYIEAFFGKYLMAAESPLLNADRTPYPEVELRSYTGSNIHLSHPTRNSQ